MVIGSRMLQFGDARNRINVPIELFAPKIGEEGGWFCRYTIGWPHDTQDSAGWGCDALQAIVLTLKKIGLEIYASEYHQSGQLVWKQPGGGYGFPVPNNGRDQLIGDDKLYE